MKLYLKEKGLKHIYVYTECNKMIKQVKYLEKKFFDQKIKK